MSGHSSLLHPPISEAKLRLRPSLGQARLAGPAQRLAPSRLAAVAASMCRPAGLARPAGWLASPFVLETPSDQPDPTLPRALLLVRASFQCLSSLR